MHLSNAADAIGLSPVGGWFFFQAFVLKLLISCEHNSNHNFSSSRILLLLAGECQTVNTDHTNIKAKVNFFFSFNTWLILFYTCVQIPPKHFL